MSASFRQMLLSILKINCFKKIIKLGKIKKIYFLISLIWHKKYRIKGYVPYISLNTLKPKMSFQYLC